MYIYIYIFPQISTTPPIRAPPIIAALITIVTIFHWELNQDGYGTSMQTIKHRQYCWYLDFWYCWYFIIFGLVIVKTYVSLFKGNIYSFTLLSLSTNVCYSVWKSIKFFSVCRNSLFLDYKHSNQYVKNKTTLFSAT